MQAGAWPWVCSLQGHPRESRVTTPTHGPWSVGAGHHLGAFDDRVYPLPPLLPVLFT